MNHLEERILSKELLKGLYRVSKENGLKMKMNIIETKFQNIYDMINVNLVMDID